MIFDIVIVGGGMVGASLASALAPFNLNVALIDAALQFPQNDHRLIALNHTSCNLFKNIGIWNALEPYAAPIKEIHVSHRGSFGVTRLNAADNKLLALGHVVPAKYINAALYNNLNHITQIYSAKLIALTQDTNQVELSIETPAGNKNIVGKKIIAADGSFSTVRELLNIPTQKIDYAQTALVTTTELQRSHENIAYERFINSGAIAMLPLCGNQAATIWTDKTENIKNLMSLTDEDFTKTLQKQFGYRLGRFVSTGKRFTYPLQMICAEQQVKQHVCLIGNAAHTVHPVAAQGLNLALYEIALLVDQIKQQGLDNWFVDFKISQQDISVKLSHGLKQLFATDFPIVNAVRQLGVLGFECIPPLKRAFINRLLGNKGIRPSLLKEDVKNGTLS